MTGNILGQAFTLTTCGESHGAGYLGIVDGCPPGLPLSEADIQTDLDRRRPGRSRHVTQRREPDKVQIFSGVFEGVTTGTPIGLVIHNEDQKSKDYANIKDLYRPGHADFTYRAKYGRRDYRGGGRSSARETCMRVAAGAIARKYLRTAHGVEVRAWLSQLGPLDIECRDLAAIDTNPFFAPDPEVVPELESYMDALRKDGDSIGARISVCATNVPAGLGEPIFDRLDADIAKAMMSINAVKGVEFGDGFDVVAMRGTEHRDELDGQGFRSNHAGGVLGGISTGQNIVVGIALKPTSSIRIPGATTDVDGNEREVVTKGRHDPCVGLRAAPIAEAMLALVLMDHLLRFRGQCSDVDRAGAYAPALEEAAASASEDR